MEENFFKSRREELGLTQFDVAIAVGLNGASPVGQWENWINCPSIRRVSKLAIALKVPPARILAEIHKQDTEILRRREPQSAGK